MLCPGREKIRRPIDCVYDIIVCFKVLRQLGPFLTENSFQSCQSIAYFTITVDFSTVFVISNVFVDA